MTVRGDRQVKRAVVGELEIAYRVDGPSNGEPLLLIIGLAGQLTAWPQELIDGLTRRMFRVISYDARDVGLSTWLDAAGIPNQAAITTAIHRGESPPVPYHLEDMAADAVGLLDALGVDSAHLAGSSMGGAVAQIVAADYPRRARSLTSMMSTTDNPDLPTTSPRLVRRLSQRPVGPDVDLEGYLDEVVATAIMAGSPAYPVPEPDLRAQVRADHLRAHNPAGGARHLAAVMAAPDRRPKLRLITVPSLVIHGDSDPMYPLPHGQDTADAIPGAELLVLPGMGHNIPVQLCPMIADAITAISQQQL